MSANFWSRTLGKTRRGLGGYRRWGSNEAVEDDVGEGLEEAGTVAVVAVADQGQEWLLAGSLRGRDDGEDDGVEGDVVELSRRGEALDARRDIGEDGANVAVQDIVKAWCVAPGLVVHDGGQVWLMGVGRAERADGPTEAVELGAGWIVHRGADRGPEALLGAVHDRSPEGLFGSIPVIDAVVADADPTWPLAHRRPVVAELAERLKPLGEDHVVGRNVRGGG